MASSITIVGRSIGPGEPPYLIVDAGVNHNGSLETAKRLVDAAKAAGADAVKFQTFKTENLVTKSAERCSYQEKNIGGEETQFEMLKRLELHYEDFKTLKEYCDEQDVLFLSTPHTLDAVDFLDELMPTFKIGSPDLTNIPLLKAVARKGKPIILPTGMATMQEVKEALAAIVEEGNEEVVVLHCTSNYPCPRDEVNLRAMETMRKELDLPVGYSDHTLGIDVSLMAAKMGAVLLEKHFTLDKGMEGPDHVASLDPAELAELVTRLRAQDYSALDEEVLGSPEKRPNPSELEIMKRVRKSVVAATAIRKGEPFTEQNLAIKRPGTGLHPKAYYGFLGKTATRDISEDEVLKEDDAEGVMA